MKKNKVYNNGWYDKMLKRFEPKKRSISYLHDLWLRTKKRADKRHADIREYILNVIVKNVEPNENGEYFIYYEDDGYLYSYKFRYDEKVDSYWVSRDTVDRKTREGKIASVVGSDGMGNRYRYLAEELRPKFSYHVFNKLWEQVKEEIRATYKPVSYYKDDIIKIEIDGHFYNIYAKPMNEYYIEFTWIGDDNNILLNLK